MGVLTRYITRELIIVFLLVFLLLVCMGLGGRFVSLLQDAAGGRYSIEALWWLIGLRISTFVQLIVPFSIFLAITVTFGRLHADQEFVTLTSGGVTPSRMLAWQQWVLIPLAVMVGFFSMQITPAALKLLSEMASNQRVITEFDAIIPGTFRSFSKDARVSYVEDVDRGEQEVSGVFMNEIRGNRVVSIWADKGRYFVDADTGNRYLMLENGVRYEGHPTKHDYQVIRFEKLAQQIELGESERLVNEPSVVPTGELRLTVNAEAAEWHWRVALPILTFVGAMCGFGIARVPPRSGRFGRVIPGLGLFVLYYVLLVFGKSLIEGTASLQIVGLWPVHGLMALTAWVLIRKSYRPV